MRIPALPKPKAGDEVDNLSERQAPASESHSAETTVCADRPSEAETAVPVRSDWLFWAGTALIMVQGAAMLAWSTLLWHRFALTRDYAIYHQAWWLIAHGHLDPFDTALGLFFWRNHFELFMWPLAILGVVFPHGPVLLYAQDTAVVGAEFVAWKWIYAANGSRPKWIARSMLITGLVILLADPWPWWAISWDFHIHLIGAAFVLAAGYELSHRGRKRTWVAVGLALLCGAVVASYVAGLGVACLLAGRRWRHQGLALLASGVGWTLLVSLAHANQGVPLTALYGHLAGSNQLPPGASLTALASGILRHPLNVATVLWAHRLDIWGNLAPSGLIGLLDPWAFGMSLPVLLANQLTPGYLFSQPDFQSALVYLAVPIGTVLFLTWLSRHLPRLVFGIAALVAANALGWGIVWLPRLEPSWIELPRASAAEVRRADAIIPPMAEVVASNGVIGRFSDREYLYDQPGPAQSVPIHGNAVWWVIVPSVGIETVPVAASAALVQALAGPMHAQLVTHAAGVWVFRWSPRPDTKDVTVPAASQGALSPWVVGGNTGVPVLAGPPISWHLESNGSSGYVLDKDYWREPPGSYKVTVRLAASEPTYAEVWNATGNVLLTRRELPPTDGLETFSVIVHARRQYRHMHFFSGWGPFRTIFVPPPRDNQLEVRIWSPGEGVVDVQSVALQRAR